MKSVIFAALVLVSSQSFAANVSCAESQVVLKKAHVKFDKVVAALNFSYNVCPQAPDAALCTQIFLDAYEKSMQELREAGSLRNEACAE